MAKRKRNIRERQDYRQGGRVALARGGKRGAKRKATPKIRKPVEDPRPTPQVVGLSDKPITKTKPVKPTVRPSKKPVIPGNEPFPVEPPVIKEPARPRPQVPTLPPVDPTVSRPAEPTVSRPAEPTVSRPAEPTVSRPERPAETVSRPERPDRPDKNGETSPGGGMWWKEYGYDTLEDAISDGWYWDTDTGQWTIASGNTDNTTTTTDNTNTTTTTNTDDTTTESGFDSKAYAQQLAQGEGPQGEAIIKPAEQVDTGIYTDKEVNTSWQEGGLQGTLLTNEQGLTGKNIFEALWGAGDGTNPADSVEIDGTTYVWEDFHNLIKQEATDFIGKEKPDSPYKMSETEMLALTDEQRAAATKAGYIPDETVTKGIAQPDVSDPDAITAGTYTGDIIDQETAVNAKTLEELSPGSTADLQTQSLTMQAQGVDVTADYRVGDEKTLTDRVIGTLGPEAMAEFQKVAGTDLPRVLRAKKQLRRAGLTEDQINLIGNDPELLEDELMDYTEAERGMIAGLPDEALVSTQLTSLLDGIESGEIPAFARPAVAAVNEMLVARGLSASTVGRDALINSLITAAMPLAQSNAQSIKESVMSQRTIEAQAEQLNAQMRQQTALDRADKTFSMDMAQFTSDQQIALSNSKFLQTVTLTDANNEQQAMMQNAASNAQLDLATLDSNTKLVAQNAQAFLQLDMTNLNNRQQSEVLRAKMNQDRMLSNQASTNASLQFNATSENQTNQFMSNLKTQIDLNNAARQDSMEQFNATQDNAKEARRVGIAADIAKFDAQLVTQVDQFNAQQDFARNQWNAQNSAAVEASNVEWRRQANTINTAAQNAINAQNAQNAFQMSSQSLAFLWQELRDQADFDFRAVENDENRKAQIVATALANEGKSGEKYDDYLTGIVSSFASSLNTAYTGFQQNTTCFMKGTMVEMVDGSTKEISTIQLGDYTKGGEVLSTLQAVPQTLYDYKGIKVTGSHTVREDGIWTEVENSKYGVLTDMVEPVYTLISSYNRMFIEGIEFGDYLLYTDGMGKGYLPDNAWLPSFKDMQVWVKDRNLNKEVETIHG